MSIAHSTDAADRPTLTVIDGDGDSFRFERSNANDDTVAFVYPESRSGTYLSAADIPEVISFLEKALDDWRESRPLQPGDKVLTLRPKTLTPYDTDVVPVREIITILPDGETAVVKGDDSHPGYSFRPLSLIRRV